VVKLKQTITGKPQPWHSGDRNVNWKGGITLENHKIRTSLNTIIWRRSIFLRDGYTCFFCGKRGGDIHAHHIKSFAKFPALRFALGNGVTLCKMCHNKIHRKGGL
jgi:hypothetical protein